jgi:transcription elongation factor Elf1
MARTSVEFQCTNCSYWNYPMMSDAMDGNYTVKCGNCGHEHYRLVEKGVVTDIRHNYEKDHGDTIHVMKSACSADRREEGKIVNVRRGRFAGLFR